MHQSNNKSSSSGGNSSNASSNFSQPSKTNHGDSIVVVVANRNNSIASATTAETATATTETRRNNSPPLNVVPVKNRQRLVDDNGQDKAECHQQHQQKQHQQSAVATDQVGALPSVSPSSPMVVVPAAAQQRPRPLPPPRPPAPPRLYSSSTTGGAATVGEVRRTTTIFGNSPSASPITAMAIGRDDDENDEDGDKRDMLPPAPYQSSYRQQSAGTRGGDSGNSIRRDELTRTAAGTTIATRADAHAHPLPFYSSPLRRESMAKLEHIGENGCPETAEQQQQQLQSTRVPAAATATAMAVDGECGQRLLEKDEAVVMTTTTAKALKKVYIKIPPSPPPLHPSLLGTSTAAAGTSTSNADEHSHSPTASKPPQHHHHHHHHHHNLNGNSAEKGRRQSITGSIEYTLPHCMAESMVIRERPTVRTQIMVSLLSGCVIVFCLIKLFYWK